MGSAEIVFRFLMPRADRRNGMKGRGEEGGEAANPIPTSQITIHTLSWRHSSMFAYLHLECGAARSDLVVQNWFLLFAMKPTCYDNRGPDIFFVFFPSKIRLLSPSRVVGAPALVGGRGYMVLSFGTLGTGQSYFATKEPDIIPKTCGYLRSHLLLCLQALFPGNGPERKVCVRVCVPSPSSHLLTKLLVYCSFAYTSREILSSLPSSSPAKHFPLFVSRPGSHGRGCI